MLLVKLLILVSAAGSLSCGSAYGLKPSETIAQVKPIVTGNLQEFKMISPGVDKHLQFLNISIIYNSDTKQLYYSLKGNTQSGSYENNQLGFITGDREKPENTKDNFYNSFQSVEMLGPTEIHDAYNTRSGKRECVDYTYNSYTLTATNASNKKMQIECRLYDTGFAFRYKFDSDGIVNDKEDTNNTEKTTFAVYTGDNCRYIYQQGDQDKYEEDYERLYENSSSLNTHTYRVFPFLETKKGEPAILFAEAGLDGTYSDSGLYSSEGSPNLQVMPTKQERTWEFNFTPRTISMNNFVSPWRVFIIGSYGDIITSDIVDHLNNECAIEDTSWIQPGTCSWSWKESEDKQDDEEFIKKYVDFASEMGWKYYIMDAGWPMRIEPWLAQDIGLIDTSHQDDDHLCDHYMLSPQLYSNRLVQYAKEKNVGLIVWIHNSQICDATDNYAKMDGCLAAIAAAGYKGVKADFFEYPCQNLDRQLMKLYEYAAKYHLVVNVHGCNLPTGERRTYPNVINREAIFGQEHERGRDYINPTLILSNAYARSVVGPVDFTPYVNAGKGTNMNLVSQMGIPIVLESGCTCIASKPDVFESVINPVAIRPHVKNFYRNLPSSWKRTEFISGSPNVDDDLSLVLARQARNGDWYISGIFDDAKDSYTIKFSDFKFLDTGATYCCDMFYEDGDSSVSKTNAAYEFLYVNSNTEKTIKINDNGGFVMKLSKEGNKINITNTPNVEIKAYRGGTEIVSGETETGYDTKLNLVVTTNGKDPLPEYVYVNEEPFYVIPDPNNQLMGVVNGINEIRQQINISAIPPFIKDSTRTIDVSSDSGGSIAVCDDLRKYYRSGDVVKVGDYLTVNLKYDEDVYTAQLKIDEDDPISITGATYSFAVPPSTDGGALSIKAIFTKKS